MPPLYCFLLITTLFYGSSSGKRNESVYEPVAVSQSQSIFEFNTFKKATVVFRNKASSHVLMNYNLLHGQLQFINENADTLLLTNKYLIDQIIIENRVFVLGATEQDNDLEIICEYARAGLAKLNKLVLGGNASSGSAQQFRASSSSIPSSLFITNQTGEFQWQNTTLSPDGHLKSIFYLLDANRRAYPMSQKSLHRLYPRQWSVLRTYVKTHTINYSNQEDMLRLLAYLEAND